MRRRCRGRTVRLSRETPVAGRRVGCDGELERGRAGGPARRCHTAPVGVAIRGPALWSLIGSGGLVSAMCGASRVIRGGGPHNLAVSRDGRAVRAGTRHRQQRTQPDRPDQEDRERTLHDRCDAGARQHAPSWRRARPEARLAVAPAGGDRVRVVHLLVVDLPTSEHARRGHPTVVCLTRRQPYEAGANCTRAHPAYSGAGMTSAMRSRQRTPHCPGESGSSQVPRTGCAWTEPFSWARVMRPSSRGSIATEASRRMPDSRAQLPDLPEPGAPDGARAGPPRIGHAPRGQRRRGRLLDTDRTRNRASVSRMAGRAPRVERRRLCACAGTCAGTRWAAGAGTGPQPKEAAVAQQPTS